MIASAERSIGTPPVRLRLQGWLPWSDSRGVAGVAAQVEAESQLPEVLMTYVHTIRKMAQWFALADADVVLYAAKVTVWGRWIVWFFAAVLLVYRPGLWYPEDIGYALLNVTLATLNGVFHYRLLTNRPVTWRWMVGLSAMDIALITANIAVSGRFDNYIFLTYYPGSWRHCRGLHVLSAEHGLGHGGRRRSRRRELGGGAPAWTSTRATSGRWPPGWRRCISSLWASTSSSGSNASGGRPRWQGSGRCSRSA